MWELCNYIYTKCALASVFLTTCTLWFCCGLGRHPFSLLPLCCSDISGTPGLWEGLGSSRRCPGLAAHWSIQGHFLLFQGWQVVLASEEGRPDPFLFFFSCLGSRKAREMKLQLALKNSRKPPVLYFKSLYLEVEL